ncbi:hypothetical protein SAMN04488542_13841 [Fontibacillus panacisegetis]|uniref:Addiction module component n=1 Tax=Fontibacillus panacisegetis TaxID=670482 RepID=A0A1G7TP87_9BACL|nr:hypothetical protein [Fontibacillus panacisegetis]SDG37085.1 hypothetical protein SAMN04488542_13841 [Fontibacillus panacisegetis]
MAMSKKDLTDLIDKLSEKDIPYHIPYDDEPLTEDDLQAIREAKKEYLEGKTIKFEDILAELQS